MKQNVISLAKSFERAFLPKEGYKRLFSISREGIVFAHAVTGRLLHCNPSFVRLFGYSKDELTRLSLTDLHPLEVWDQLKKIYATESVRTPKCLLEVRCQKGNGTEFYADIQAIRVESKLNGVIQAIFRDVTERKFHWGRLMERQVEMEGLVDSQAELIMILDSHGKILQANRSVTKALDYAGRSLVGRHVASLSAPAGKPGMEEILQRALSGEIVRGFDTEFVKRNDGRIQVHLDLFPIKVSSDHKVERLALVAQDTREQVELMGELLNSKKEIEELYGELKEAYREVKATQEELVRQEKLSATGELAAGVAHEIRNPLSIINMSVQYLHGKLAPEDPLREFTEAVIEKVNRLDTITKELIQYGRPRQLQLQKVNLHRVTESCLRLAAARCQAQRVIIHRNYARYLPAVHVDEGRMDEVFSNLITNALDVMQEGGYLTITTGEDLEEKRVTVEIANTGKGIPPGKREKLFTPFFTTKPDGTGLGLAICQRIVTQHGGSISVESKISGKNKGTRVMIALPS